MSIFNNLKPRSTASRNGFDLSQRTVFSNKVGIIRPCLALHTLPSSEYEIDMQQLMRTQPLQTAAFTGAQINYDFVFVPYNHLYSSFNQFIAQRQNKDLANQPTYQSIPKLNLGRFLYYLLPLAAVDYFLSGISEERRKQYILKAYNEEDKYFDYSPTALYYLRNTPSYAITLSAVSQLDMLGYGNYLPLVKMLSNALIEYVYGLSSTAVPRPSSYLTDPQFAKYYMLMHYFTSRNSGHFPYDLSQTIVDDINDKFVTIYGYSIDDYLSAAVGNYVSLWPVLAYNKCFYEYYRNTYYDTECVMYQFLAPSNWETAQPNRMVYNSVDYVMTFNMDDNPDFSSIEGGEFNRLLMTFAQKAHLYKRDMFTGVLPSTQFGDVSTMLTDSSSLVHKIFATSNASTQLSTRQLRINTGQTTVSVASAPGGEINQFAIDPAFAISVLEARKADAMQRFKERMLRAGDKTKDIFVAHGWTEPKSQSAYEPVFLGSYDGRLDINTVAATSPTEDVELGQLGANGVCVVSGNKIRVKTSDFGVILCLQYIVKSAEYDAYGVDKVNTNLEAFDFPYPELQNISLVPISFEHLNFVAPYLNGNNMDTPASVVLGYLARSFEYKTAVDKIHGEFYTSSIIPYKVGNEEYEPAGVFSDWVTPRYDIRQDNALNVGFHYIQINAMDNVFKMAANSLPSTDQFLFNVAFDIKAVEPLPVIGLPI